MRALATAALLGGLWGASLPGRSLPPGPPHCAPRIEVRGPEHRSVLACAGDLAEALAAVGAAGRPPAGSWRDGDRLEVGPAGAIAVERMAGPALRLLRLPIDINGASMEDLQALPGIGPALASRLVSGRPYRSASDLAKVPGIGRKRLAALAPVVEMGTIAKASR